MSNVVDLNKFRMGAKGDPMFLGCPCGSEDGFQVVCIEGKDAAIIRALVCQSCSDDVYIEYGKIKL